MIRPFTALCVLLAGASGLYLYSEKHRTTVLDQRISRIVQDTQHIREHTAMLRGEWELLNQPDRLKALAGRFLPALHPMAPTQFVQMAALAQHLPAVPTPGAEPLMVDTPILAPLLAPVQVMARVLAPASETEAADRRSETRAAAPPRAARPAMLAAASPHRAERTRAVPGLSSAERAALHLAPLRTPPGRLAPASRLAAYGGAPARSLLRTAGVYAAPTPAEAAWRAGLRPAAASARFGGVGSSLGFSHAALPAPVPMQDGG